MTAGVEPVGLLPLCLVEEMPSVPYGGSPVGRLLCFFVSRKQVWVSRTVTMSVTCPRACGAVHGMLLHRRPHGATKATWTTLGHCSARPPPATLLPPLPCAHPPRQLAATSASVGRSASLPGAGKVKKGDVAGVAALAVGATASAGKFDRRLDGEKAPKKVGKHRKVSAFKAANMEGCARVLISWLWSLRKVHSRYEYVRGCLVAWRTGGQV